MKETPIDIGHLYETRLILSLEQKPQSNKYNQILLSQEQFKQVSKLIASFFSKDGVCTACGKKDCVEITIDDRVYILPEHLQSVEKELAYTSVK